MICRYSFTVGSLASDGLLGSLTNAIEIEPFASVPLDAALIFITFDALATWLTNTFGFHPSFAAWMYAWIAYFGVAKTIRVFAFDALSDAICELTSEAVGS